LIFLKKNSESVLRLNNTIEKQEKETTYIEQKISKGFSSQIQDLEDAIMSIEGQKLGIYSKLSEAMMTHNQVQCLFSISYLLES